MKYTDCQLERTYYSYDSIKDDSIVMHSVGQLLPLDEMLDFLGMLNKPGISVHELSLKVGSLCTCLRNLFIQCGLVKNSQLIVLELYQEFAKLNDFPMCTYSSGKNILLVEDYLQPKFCLWTVHLPQFPLQLAYATTFNSCQGFTLNWAVMDFCISVFSHDQLYTSLSRLQHYDHIQSFFGEQQKKEGGKETNDMVYRELLL